MCHFKGIAFKMRMLRQSLDFRQGNDRARIVSQKEHGGQDEEITDGKLGSGYF